MKLAPSHAAQRKVDSVGVEMLRLHYAIAVLFVIIAVIHV